MGVFKCIETDRLRIRILDFKDKETLFAYRIMPEVFAYQSWNPPRMDEVETFIRQNLATPPNTINTWLQLAICLRTGPMIGDIGIHFLEDDAQVEIGYTLSPDYQGRGYAFEAVKAVVNYLFLNLKKHRITASVDPENQKSISLLKKLGFRQEGHFKKSILIRGEWCDDVIYAMLEEEWINQ
jgi:RimJ/RimL family protein N-acetyltransferase